MNECSIDTVAQRLLLGITLEDKMWMPEKITQESTKKQFPLPSIPGRPPLLSFGKGRSPFPTAKELKNPYKRAEALLFFANHELLAIELMALFILRFPSTPWKLRRGLMHIIAEEQEHLRLYVQRAMELGKEVGSVPVNRFFWDSLYKMSSPEEFLSAMSLTFEQANLDHCVYYAQLFREAQDTRSAEIMDRIYADEIRHVRHGRHWSVQYGAQNLWDFHTRNLHPPLTPARAKGKVFDKEGREKVGFSDSYIQSLRLYNSSRGRVPFLWECNPSIEHMLCHDGPQPKIVRNVQKSLSLLPIFLCARDDIVLVPAQPSTALLEKLSSFGYTIPEFAVGRASIHDRKIQGVIPWGKNPSDPLWKESDRKHYTKSYGAYILREFLAQHSHPLLNPEEPVGIVCTTLLQVQEAIQSWSRPVVIKADLGASGRNTIRFMGTWEQGQEAWISRTLAQQGACVVEPILDRVMDFSMQIHIDNNDRVRQQGPIRQFTTPQGQYLGHWLGAVHKGLPTKWIRTLYEHDWKKLLSTLTTFVGTYLASEGHRGVAGIDCFLYRDEENIFIRPVVEINPRHTMGHVAQSVRKRCYGPAIFSLARRSPIEESTMTMKKGLCAQGHARLNENNATIGVFLTVSAQICAQWCVEHQIPYKPI